MWWPFGGNAFPGTNLQDINLDWIIKRIKELSSGIIAPYIDNVTFHWMVYDTQTEQFADSGVVAKGTAGKSPYIGTNGNWFVYDEEAETYVDSGKPSRGDRGEPGSPGLTKDMLAFVVTGARSNISIPANRYVIVSNSTMPGVPDGLYKAAVAIPANTTLNSTYFTAVSNGGLNNSMEYVHGDSVTMRMLAPCRLVTAKDGVALYVNFPDKIIIPAASQISASISGSATFYPNTPELYTTIVNAGYTIGTIINTAGPVTVASKTDHSLTLSIPFAATLSDASSSATGLTGFAELTVIINF